MIAEATAGERAFVDTSILMTIGARSQGNATNRPLLETDAGNHAEDDRQAAAKLSQCAQ